MKTLRYLALAALALIAIRLAGRALRRSDETTRLLWVLIATIAAKSSNTPKTRSVEQRVAALVSAVQPIVQNVATVTTTANNAQTAVTALQTGNTGFANALGYGPTSTADPAGVPTGGPDSTLYGLTTSDQTGGAASHTHTLPFYLPTATHAHDFDGHTHDFGGHAHPIT